MARFDLGCGIQSAKAPGHVGIDIIEGSDIVYDLNKGLPDYKAFHDEYWGKVEGIRSSHLIEHLDTIIPLMNDCYGVMAEGALLEISTPFFNTIQAAQDPTHKRMGFVPETFLYFIKDSPFKKEQEEYKITARFEIVRNERGTGVDDFQLFVTLRKGGDSY